VEVDLSYCMNEQGGRRAEGLHIGLLLVHKGQEEQRDYILVSCWLKKDEDEEMRRER